MVRVIAVDLQYRVRTPGSVPQGLLECEHLGWVGENDRIVFVEHVVELAHNRHLVLGEGEPKSTEVTRIFRIHAAVQVRASFGRQCPHGERRNRLIERPGRQHAIPHIAATQKRKYRNRVSNFVQAVGQLHHRFVVPSWSSQLIRADQDHSLLPTHAVIQILDFFSAPTAFLAKHHAAFNRGTFSWSRRTRHTALIARTRSAECESSCAAR